MEFMVTGRDGSDSGAPERRVRARERHLANMKELAGRGLVRDEPYMTEGVWVSVTVEPCAIGPMFRH